MTRIFSILAGVIVSGLAWGCGSPSAPARSPTDDAQPPATSTGDGKVIGADNVPPAQKLEEGPTVDSKEGIKPRATTPPKE